MDPNDGQPPEPTLPSAEQMRARRLAKLGANIGAGAASPSASATTSSLKPETDPSGAAASSSSSSSAAASTPTPATNITITPKPRSSVASEKQTSGNHDPADHRDVTHLGMGRDSSPSKRRRLADVASHSGPPANAPTDRSSQPASGSGYAGSGSPDRVPTLKPTKTPTPMSSQAQTPVPTAAVTPASTPAGRTLSPAETLSEWTTSTIAGVLHITVLPDETHDRHGRALTFLPDLRAGIQERERGTDECADGEAKPLKLTMDDIDPAFLEACSAYSAAKPLLEYLLPVYKSIGRLLKTRVTVPQRMEVLQELRRLCMSNIVFALTMPEYFGRESNPEHDTLVPYLLRGVRPDDPLSLDMDFITDAVARFDDDDDDGQLQDAFTRAMVEISARLARMSMNDEYLPYVEAMLTYTRFKPLVAAVARHASFQMATSAPNIELLTLLGPFFRISPLQPEVAKTYFGGFHKTELTRKETIYGALQMTLTTHQANLHAIAMAFARAGDAPRNRLLDWFAYTMNTNHRRRAMQVNAREVSSDGFMLNVAAVLDRMCEPFLDAGFSRMERIEVEYLRRTPRVDIRDETKLNADQAQSDAFYASRVPGESKFVSELFFLNMASHHYGSGALRTKFKDMDREIKHMEDQLARLEEERKKLTAAAAANPRAMTLIEQHLKTYTEAIDRHVAYKYALEAVLLDEKMQARALMFMRFVAVWLLRVASGTPYTPDQELPLPLPRAPPDAFSCLPEYVLQNVVDHIKFLFRRVPRILPSAVGDEMVALCITFLESSEYIRNPYLKSSLVSLLFSGTWRMYHLAGGVLGDSLTNSKFANKYLLHALMKFYIECELTGAHTQFYDKFNIRYEIFQVIKAVWPNDLYKRQLTKQSQTNRPFFVQFVNLLLNDATYVLDEALSRFPKIHELQRELQNPNALRPEERQQKEVELQAAENQAQSYMQLANETVAMMKLFTAALSEAFTMPEIVSRLAGMLDYNLVTLAGPTSRNLKVENPEKYFFNAKVLLPQIVELYLNLGDKERFVEAVANDGRSYKPAIFENATRILATKALMEPAKLQAWDALRDQFAAAKARVDQAELDLGEIPAEFEDPIMGDLMTDPVVLPSRHIVDRSTIVQHLLSDPKDPFTRQPMTIDDAMPATDLKQQIDSWKAERIAAARKNHAAEVSGASEAPVGIDAMDITDE